jgi:diaminohydroxyphosphoribosylaminopyrimidine deaminase/5-amino-6-(5-phosphoribosylamino)uracil reductase
MKEDLQDQYYMRKTLRLARKGMGKTSPNPIVGAVLVRQGKEIGYGYHKGPGHPHAERIALAAVGGKGVGATLYTNLEPCCHTQKRTPPCTNAIIESGISRVVIAMNDPNSLVNGKGIQILREAGIIVTRNLMQDQAMRLNEIFVKYMTTQTPFVILKAAMTLDGRIATPIGESKWITADAARRAGRRLRSQVDAVLVGIGTVLADDPMLLAERDGFKNPLRVVIDPDLAIPVDSQLVTSLHKAQTLVFTTAPAASKKAQRLKKMGVLVETFPDDSGEIPWGPLLRKLGRMGMTSLLIEGGGGVNGRALRDGIVDKAIFFIAPRLLCGNDAKAVVDGKAIRSLSDAVQLRDMKIRKVGVDLCIEGYLSEVKIPLP